jgi:hypothetical protein
LYPLTGALKTLYCPSVASIPASEKYTKNLKLQKMFTNVVRVFEHLMNYKLSASMTVAVETGRYIMSAIVSELIASIAGGMQFAAIDGQTPIPENAEV